jgi:hypothetical protein
MTGHWIFSCPRPASTGRAHAGREKDCKIWSTEGSWPTHLSCRHPCTTSVTTGGPLMRHVEPHRHRGLEIKDPGACSGRSAGASPLRIDRGLSERLRDICSIRNQAALRCKGAIAVDGRPRYCPAALIIRGRRSAAMKLGITRDRHSARLQTAHGFAFKFGGSLSRWLDQRSLFRSQH